MTTSATALSPSIAEVQDAAIEISRILRDAKVDAPLRPKAFAAILVAAAHGALSPELDHSAVSAMCSDQERLQQRPENPRDNATRPSATKVAVHFEAFCGAVEAVPFRNKHGNSFFQQSGEPCPSEGTLETVNRAVKAALAESSLPCEIQRDLASALRLGGPDFERLEPFLPSIAAVLEHHNLPGLLHSNIDFLGVFYEAFLRYGFDNNALGIVFTPRHITRFCVDLLGVGPKDRAIDIACGTGGFLVAAHDAIQAKTTSTNEHVQDPHLPKSGRCGAPAMRSTATFSTETQRHREEGQEQALFGFDTNPTVWALASLNMIFRGDGDARIQLGSCFDAENRSRVRRRFTRAFLNPPFSQNAEPERDFIDATMETLVPGGRCAVVVKAGIFADEEHAAWRTAFVQRHRVLGVISLPDDVFYPTAAPSSILLVEAHVPQCSHSPVLMAHVWNDGFEKLKNKRVPRTGSELPEVKRCFDALLAGKQFNSSLAAIVTGKQLLDGAEWSPQEWLPQPLAVAEEIRRGQQKVAASMFRAVAQLPELADAVLENFAQPWRELPMLPLGQGSTVQGFFQVLNGRSAGEKRYPEGAVPYVSSGDSTNSVVRLVEPAENEVFCAGGITVTAFGQAAVQPWPFVARGNGGSAVRVLIPRYRMSISELAWFAAQINMQRWRFFYARMAIQSRIERLAVTSPPRELPKSDSWVSEKVREFRAKLAELSEL